MFSKSFWVVRFCLVGHSSSFRSDFCFLGQSIDKWPCSWQLKHLPSCISWDQSFIQTVLVDDKVPGSFLTVVLVVEEEAVLMRPWALVYCQFFWIQWLITSRRLAVWEQKEVNCLKDPLELISAIVSSCSLVVIQWYSSSFRSSSETPASAARYKNLERKSWNWSVSFIYSCRNWFFAVVAWFGSL